MELLPWLTLVGIIAILCVMIWALTGELTEDGGSLRQSIKQAAGFGAVVAIFVAPMFGLTWLIEKLIDRLGPSFDGEYGVAFMLSMVLVLGGFATYIMIGSRRN